MSVFVGGCDFRGLTPDLEKTFGRFGIIESVKQHGSKCFLIFFSSFLVYCVFCEGKGRDSLVPRPLSRSCGWITSPLRGKSFPRSGDVIHPQLRE